MFENELTYNDTVGKIEDAGAIVQGGGIDRYWQRNPISLDYKKLFNDTITSDWLFDSELAVAHFKLRSIEFGNWMTQNDRANFLYASTLSLNHLAQLLDVSNSEIGMNGKLSLALGARGSGGARAHYEPLNRSVINLTKPKGIGSLAHEFAHAFDNLISFHTGQKKQAYVTGGDTTRKGYDKDIAKNGNWFEQQFEEFFNILYFDKKGNPTSFNDAMSKPKTTAYTKSRVEIFARTFEVYIYLKQQEQGIKNLFLVKSGTLYKSSVYPPTKLVQLVTPLIDKIIKRGFNLLKQNKPLSGIVTVSGYDGLRKTLKKNASLDDTLTNMQRIARRDMATVKDLAKSLSGDSIAQTSENIWNYLRANTRYKLDRDGFEELRTPVRSLVDGKKGLTDSNFGIDCDDYTILISAMLLGLGIAHEYRVTAYKAKGKFQHIYPVAFDENGKEYVMDVVPEIPSFNHEAKPIIDLKTVPMELHELSGVQDEMQLSEMELQKEDLQAELNEPFSLSGMDDLDDDMDDSMLEDSFLSGFGEVETEEEAEIVINGLGDLMQLLDRGVLAEVNKAKMSLESEMRNPTVISQTVNVRREYAMLKALLQRWNNETARDAAIQNAINSGSSYRNFYLAIRTSLDEMEQDGLQGIEDEQLDEPIYLAQIDMTDIAMDDLLNDPDPNLQGLGDLGRRRRRRGFFRKLWRGVKKVGKKIGKGLKKAWKAVKRFNPLSVAARAAIRGVLRLNFFKIASRLIYGYLTQAQAQQKGLDLNEWRKVVRAKDRAEKFYTRMGGKASKFRRAVVRGRAAKKTGLQLSGMDDLGAVVTATAAGAASPFLLFIKKILRAINPARLFKKIKNKIRAKRNGNQTPTFSNNQFSPNANIMQQNSFVPSNQFNTNNSLVPQQPVGFKAKLFAFFKRNKKRLYAVGIIGILAVLGVMFWNKNNKKKKRSLAGIKAAKTRARNRKKSLAGVPVRRATTTRRLTTPKRRSTTRTKTPRLSGTTTRRTTKRSNGNRLKAMHKKAKQLQKTHPRSKYPSLLKKAAKMI